MGGLARRAGWIEQNRPEETPWLLLDSGDFLPREATVEYGTELASLMLDLYAGMGYAAVNIGQAELNLPVETLSQQLEQAGVTGVASNILNAGSHVFSSRATVEVGNRVITILGITLPRTNPEDPEQAIAFQDPRAAVKGALDAADRDSDLVVVLSNAGEAVDKSLAREFPAIDLILQSGRNLSRDKAEKFADTWILCPASKGRSVGRTRVVFGSGGQGVEVIPSFVWLDDPSIASKGIEEELKAFQDRTARMTKNRQGSASGSNPFVELLKRRQKELSSNNGNRTRGSQGEADNPFLKLIQEMQKKQAQERGSQDTEGQPGGSKP